jgi:hypothetical protein
VLFSFQEFFHSSSELVKIIPINQINSFIGLRVNQVFFHFINAELALLQSHCQSSFVGLRSICITADSSSSSLEKALVMLFIGSDSNFRYVLIGKNNSFVVFKYVHSTYFLFLKIFTSVVSSITASV